MKNTKHPGQPLILHKCPHLAAHGFSESLPARFWDKVNQNGEVPKHCPEIGKCWNWIGTSKKHGYGQIGVGGCDSSEIASRVSWIMHNGPIPEGLNVLHKCDNPPCIRPSHLFLGTDLDNSRDKIAKGRQGDPPRATLNWEKVDEIRFKHSAGESYKSLALRFGVKEAAISRICTFKRWHPQHRINSTGC